MTKSRVCSGPWDQYVSWQKLGDLDAPHEPDRELDLEAITLSMRAEGWVGRPLLASDYGEPPLTCQTGSHRLAAARKAPLATVPVVVVNCESALELAQPPLVFEMLRDCAAEVSPELVAAVRRLWELDGYPE
jgi:hypothetical protein